jgi:PAS domain-containing protein
VETHEDVTGRNPKHVLADERMALQLLIDQVPDYLWIKDTESRFVVVNKALATDLWSGYDQRFGRPFGFRHSPFGGRARFPRA